MRCRGGKLHNVEREAACDETEINGLADRHSAGRGDSDLRAGMLCPSAASLCGRGATAGTAVRAGGGASRLHLGPGLLGVVRRTVAMAARSLGDGAPRLRVARRLLGA